MFAAWFIGAGTTRGLAQSLTPSNDISRLHWRFLGPVDYSGKINDITLPGPKSGDTRPAGTVMYVASATGGLFKTENGGMTWLPIFDRELVTAIYSVTIAPSNANIVWVGTGEPAPWPYFPVPGNGAYKSIDGGKSWTDVGLVATQYVARIAVHPTNPSIVFAGTLGSLSRPSADRGLYRTRDGGATWERVLFVNEWTGVIDVAIDPVDPMTVYAAAQQRAENALGKVAYGPGSGLYKSIDGGSTWLRLSNGLPSTRLGRCGIAVYPGRHTTVYALIDNADPHAGDNRGVALYRSDDSGEHWRRGGATIPDPYARGTYFGSFALDPSNVDRVYVGREFLMVSEDAGATFNRVLVAATSDYGSTAMPDVHAIWVDPGNPDHLIVGYDRGVRTSVDRAKSWYHFPNIPAIQSYSVAIDRAEPFANVNVSTNDNWVLGAPVRTRHTDGVTADDWIMISDVEGVGVLSDPSDTTMLYNATGPAIRMYDRVTRATTLIGGDISGEMKNSFTMPAALALSPSRTRTVYLGLDRVLRSNDRGGHWGAISARLVHPADSTTLLGEAASARYAGISLTQGVSAISESPRDSNVVYAGTTDGIIHWTRDAGAHWASSKDDRDLPAGSSVSAIVAAHASAGTAYAMWDGSRIGDFLPHVYRTTDFGAHWRPMVNGLPAGAAVHGLVEHSRNTALLFAATSRGVFVSVDTGAHWQSLRNNMPGVSVLGIALQPVTNELVVATWGRGVWMLDDITPLEEWTNGGGEADRVFPTRPVIAYAEQPPRNECLGTPNPPYGATVFYYLRAGHSSDEDVQIEIADHGGTVVHRAKADITPGLHVHQWGLRPDAWTDNLGRQFADGVRAAPAGEYTIRLVAKSAHGAPANKLLAPPVPLSVRPDPLTKGR